MQQAALDKVQGSRPAHTMGKRFFVVLSLLLILMPFFAVTSAYANSAEPPSVVFIVDNPPSDLSIELVNTGDGGFDRPQFIQRAWVGYYAFYSLGPDEIGSASFKVTSSSYNFTFTLASQAEAGAAQHAYHNYYLLDLETQRCLPDDNPVRGYLMVALRVALTLLIEGAVFWLFGYRRAASWIGFIIINLATQTWLHLSFNGAWEVFSSYSILSLLVLEFPIFLVEMIAFPILLRLTERDSEHKPRYSPLRAVLYAFLANLASLVLGGILITCLPV